MRHAPNRVAGMNFILESRLSSLDCWDDSDSMKINRQQILGAGAGMLLALTGCSDTATAVATVVASKDVGPQWPFTVAEVNVVCAPTLAIFITAGGKAYPLNGQAERHPDLYKGGPVGKLNDIWKVAPEISKLLPDARMPLDAVTRKAIETCARAGKWEPSRI
jgi:hypothetical protein